MTDITVDLTLHILRNPYGFTAYERSEARQAAADKIEQLLSEILKLKEIMNHQEEIRMKTAEEKAKELMNFIGTDCSEDRDTIIKALKEQDRDTRHACAEACLRSEDKVLGQQWASAYHDVCMNTKAV